MHLKRKQVKGAVLDHLGLVAVALEELGLEEKIDNLLPVSKNKGAKVSMGQRVIAMILNGLGFMDDRLYMFQQFLENKPVDRLFGEGVKADYFTDDALGRCLDSISAHGTTQFFSELSLRIGMEQGLIGKTLHGDTSTLVVYGEYPETPGAPSTVQPKHGYSKEKRSDLKQMVLHLTTTGSIGFPVWMEAHSGNASDKKVLMQAAERMQSFANQLDLDQDFLHVGDSAFYSAAARSDGALYWLSRVPETIKEATQWLEEEEGLDWQELGNGYKQHLTSSNFAGSKQRWAVIYSEQAFQAGKKSIEKQITKEADKIEKELKSLKSKVFHCREDAENVKLKKFTYHKVSFEIEVLKKHAGKGRPKKDQEPSVEIFKIHPTLHRDEEAIARLTRRKGRFILATNQLDEKKLPSSDILKTYKEQASTERGFAFIKNDAFEVDSIFLKKPSRIEALMAIMCLCLMVYGFAQHKLRKVLEERGETIPNQRQKETKRQRDPRCNGFTAFSMVCRCSQSSMRRPPKFW